MPYKKKKQNYLIHDIYNNLNEIFVPTTYLDKIRALVTLTT